MGYSRTKDKIALNRLIFSSFSVQCDSGEITLQDDECSIDINGSFRTMFIEFKGNVHIINNLPDGYAISFIKNKIYIRNILGRNIKNDNILFRFEYNFEILSAYLYNWEGKRIILKVTDNNKVDNINGNKTNFEDSTLIIGQEEIPLVYQGIAKRNNIDDNSIKGLYAKKPLPNGYIGYYHYYPDEKIYMTGKRPSNTSVPILTGKSKAKHIKAIKKIATKIKLNLKRLGLDKVDMDKASNIKPVKTKEKELQEVAKYEQILPQKQKTKKTERTIIGTSKDVKKGSY